MMVVKRKLPILLIYMLFLAGPWPPLHAQIQRHGWNGVIVKEISPEVSVIRDGVAQPAIKLGMSLYQDDEVKTGKNGRAAIQFSSKGGGNEVILGPVTRVRVSRTSTKFDYSIYRITVIEGKIQARDLPSQSRKIRINAGKSKIIPFGGEYIVEQSPDQTLATASKGNIRVLDKAKNRYLPLPPGKIASVSGKTGELTIMVVPEPLLTAFKSTETASSKSSQEIKALVNDRVSRIDEILEQEAREAAEKKAREEALKREQEEAEQRALAKAIRKEEEETARRNRELAEQQAQALAARKKKEKAEAAQMISAARKTAPSGVQSAVKTKQSTHPANQVASVAKGKAAAPDKAKVTTEKLVEEQQPVPDREKMAVSEEPARENQRVTANEDRGPASKEKLQAAAEAEEQSPVAEQQDAPVVEEQSPVRIEKKGNMGEPTRVERAEETILPVEKPLEEESLLQTFKWDIVTLSTAVVFSWLATEEAKKYDDLESENDALQAQWANATTTSARNELEVEYEVNKSKMSTYKSNVTLYNSITMLAIIFEGYLIYDHLFGDDPDGGTASHSPGDKNIMSPDTIVLGLNHPSSPAGINLSLGWKW